jgi:hypothetical protein
MTRMAEPIFADLDALTTAPVAKIRIDGETFDIHHPTSLPPRELMKLLNLQSKLGTMTEDERSSFIEEKMAYLSPAMREFYGREEIAHAVDEARKMGKDHLAIAEAATQAGVQAVMVRIRYGKDGRPALNSEQWMAFYAAITGIDTVQLDETLRRAEEGAGKANPPEAHPQS